MAIPALALKVNVAVGRCGVQSRLSAMHFVGGSMASQRDSAFMPQRHDRALPNSSAAPRMRCQCRDRRLRAAEHSAPSIAPLFPTPAATATDGPPDPFPVSTTAPSVHAAALPSPLAAA